MLDKDGDSVILSYLLGLHVCIILKFVVIFQVDEEVSCVALQLRHKSQALFDMICSFLLHLH